MTATVIDGARQTVRAPSREARRFGLFSVVTPVTSESAHWMYGGLTADGEECSVPEWGTIDCGPSAGKSSRSWYSDIEADPWLTYMFETCKAPGRYSEAASRLRTRFLAAEQSAAELGLVSQTLAAAPAVPPIQPTLGGGIAALERDANENYGGRITLYVPPDAALDAAQYLIRVGDHLETLSGNFVSVGNYGDGTTVWASGALALYRSELTLAGPVTGSLFTLPDGDGYSRTNDYYVLAERAYTAIVDCWSGQTNIGGGP